MLAYAVGLDEAGASVCRVVLAAAQVGVGSELVFGLKVMLSTGVPEAGDRGKVASTLTAQVSRRKVLADAVEQDEARAFLLRKRARSSTGWSWLGGGAWFG